MWVTAFWHPCAGFPSCHTCWACGPLLRKPQLACTSWSRKWLGGARPREGPRAVCVQDSDSAVCRTTPRAVRTLYCAMLELRRSTRVSRSASRSAAAAACLRAAAWSERAAATSAAEDSSLLCRAKSMWIQQCGYNKCGAVYLRKGRMWVCLPHAGHARAAPPAAPASGFCTKRRRSHCREGRLPREPAPAPPCTPPPGPAAAPSPCSCSRRVPAWQPARQQPAPAPAAAPPSEPGGRVSTWTDGFALLIAGPRHILTQGAVHVQAPADVATSDVARGPLR